MSEVRTAVIGCGKVGGIHADALETLPESQFVAVCDSSPERAHAFGQKYGAKAYEDVETMVRESGAEAVFLCTPHPLHATPAIAAMNLGAHVLVEKPLASDLADCDRMIEASRKNNVRLGVISQRRFFEPVKRMKAAIDAGNIGKPVLGTVLMLSWRDEAYYQSDPWRGKWASEGGGVLVNQSPHQLDLLLWMMGPVDEIFGYWSNLNHPSVEVEDTAVATLRFRNGGLGSIVTSVSQKPGIYTKVHVHGSTGASVGVQTDTGATFVAGMSGISEPPLNDLWSIPGQENLLPQFEAEDRARFATVDSTKYYHQLQIQDFLSAVMGQRAPAVTGEDGRKVVEVFTAIYLSNRQGAPVKCQR
ncbi:MAG: Gfo/Idh/MocA family oxidoreductase [Bryobacteraceae bacterium]|nr:Gfo/Idh/MocA family oxidoreductase [Bryobacteraceae bacterium]